MVKTLSRQKHTQLKTFFFFFTRAREETLVFSATPSWLNIFCFPWWLSASCHANCKDTDGYPKHSNSIFPLLLLFPKMFKLLWPALSLLRQFLSTAIPFSLPSDSRESTLTRSCSAVQTNRPTVMHTKGYQHRAFHPSHPQQQGHKQHLHVLVDLNILASEAGICSINISLSCHDSFEFAR